MARDEELAVTRMGWTEEALSDLTNRAQRGDQRAMEELRQALRAYPALGAKFSDIAELARGQMAEVTFGKDNLLLQEMVRRRVAELRSELEGGRPTPLERMLVERIVTCWAGTYLADIDASKQRHAPAKAEYYDKRQARAHARYLSAIVALAKVRRLMAPMVAQVNIARAGSQQLNVGRVKPELIAGPAQDEVESSSS